MRATRRPSANSTLIGLTVTIGGMAAATAIMVPFRPTVASPSAALILIIPLVAGVGLAGIRAAIPGSLLGILLLDYYFQSPFNTFGSPDGKERIELAVYLVVGVIVSRVVAQTNVARHLAEARHTDATALFDVSAVLIAEQPLDDLLASVVDIVRDRFGADGAALQLADAQGDGAVHGVSRVSSVAAEPRSRTRRWWSGDLADRLVDKTVPLVAAGEHIGELVVVGLPADDEREKLLAAFANHAALAVRRVQLEAEATRVRILEEVDGLRRALVGSLSHDLRTPLASIKAAVSDLRDDELPLSEADRAILLAAVEEQTDRLTRMVNGLLDLGRIEAGSLRPRMGPTDIAALAQEAAARAVAADHVSLDLAPGLPHAVADDVLLDRILDNLLDNADRHGGGGPISLRAGVEGGRVVVRIVDHGPGIPPSERDRVFDPTARRASGGVRSGAGLGLAIAKAFVNAMDGSISIEATEGGGATFRFDLAATAPDDDTDGVDALDTHLDPDLEPDPDLDPDPTADDGSPPPGATDPQHRTEEASAMSDLSVTVPDRTRS